MTWSGCERQHVARDLFKHLVRRTPVFGGWLEELRLQHLPEFPIPDVPLPVLAHPVHQDIRGFASKALHRLGVSSHSPVVCMSATRSL